MIERREIQELSDSQLEDLANRISNKLNVMQKNEFGQLKEHSLYNTRLLLTNYDKLKAHVESVHDQMIEDQGTFWNHGFLTLSSLMQNKAKTVKIMIHVDESLNKYRDICLKKSSRGYNLLELKFFANLSDDYIADKYNVDRTTIGRQIKEAIKDLSIILFGADVLDFK